MKSADKSSVCYRIESQPGADMNTVNKIIALCHYKWIDLCHIGLSQWDVE
ncbi:hypothetical protein SAMN05421840_12137 [Shewanella morhuae]|uniref:Uncharacterized protein n=1 Tax=Shewanella morhuae TaxID=365591 RepID=A0A1N7ATC0_9GAMM|nr:hypothetical protein SAMN05421840_12137 [Shewanella morhuae]SUI93472.1 Uncharacterised protein [Shewanella morhuae]